MMDKLGNLFFPLYNRLFDEDDNLIEKTDVALKSALIDETVEMYTSKSLALGVIMGFSLWMITTAIVGIVLTFVIGDIGALTSIPVPNERVLRIIKIIRIPALIIISGIITGTIGFVLGFYGMMKRPYMIASSRKAEINALMSDSISYMYALSVGGLNYLEIFRSLADAEDTYGEVSREFQAIVNELDYFESDHRTAVQNRAQYTPSKEESQFLTDLLSILASGGDVQQFFREQKDKFLRNQERQQKARLETIELFGEMYMTLSLFPVLLLIILVVMQLLGNADTTLLLGTVYLLIPMIGVGFLVMVSTVKKESVGSGTLENKGISEPKPYEDVFGNTIANSFTEEHPDSATLQKIEKRERILRIKDAFKNFFLLLRENPLYTLIMTIPVSIAAIIVSIQYGLLPLTPDGFKSSPVGGIFFVLYVPLYIMGIPLAFFYEWRSRFRGGILGDIPDTLRKLSSQNETGQTIQGSIKIAAETSSGQISKELREIYAKLRYGISTEQALVEFNNKFHTPRLARTTNLIIEAQQASNQISTVLLTAAEATQTQEDAARDQKAQARMQLVIIIMTYFVLLLVMLLLQTQFVSMLAELLESTSSDGGGDGGQQMQLGQGLDVELIEMLFFHAVSLQAIASGFIGGYIRSGEILSGLKFVIILNTIALASWVIMV